MKTSPTQRSLKYLRENGYISQVVERWNSFAKVRQDLFGWIDIVAVGNGKLVGVQTTSYPNGKVRLEKASHKARFAAAGKDKSKVDALIRWWDAGGVLELHEWKKRRGVWEVKVTTLQSEDLE